MKPLHLSHHGLEHLLLHVLKVKVHLILHLTSQPRNLRGHALLHGCKVWLKVASWRGPLAVVAWHAELQLLPYEHHHHYHLAHVLHHPYHLQGKESEASKEKDYHS